MAVARDFFLRSPDTATFARESGETLAGLLRSIYERFVFPRVGPHCAARLRAFKEDRSLPLSTVQSTFMRLAAAARDITTRSARQLYAFGVEDDEAGRAIRTWMVEQIMSKQHVSLEALLSRHYQLCEHFSPSRTLPAQLARVAQMNQPPIPPTNRPPVNCWNCGKYGHPARLCKSQPRNPFRTEGPRRFARGGPEKRSSSLPADQTTQ